MTVLFSSDNGHAVPAFRPAGTATTVAAAGSYNVTRTGVARLTCDTATSATYGINAAASITLRTGIIEYIAVYAGDVINIAGGAVNIIEVA